MAEYDLGTARGKVVIDSDTSAVAKTNDELDKTPAKGERAAKSLNMEQALSKTSTAMIATGATIVGGLALAVKSASDFEYGMSQIQSVLGLTTAEMEPLREAALRIGKDTAFSASEASLAMEELAKAGISATDILGGAADATVALAAAGQIDLPEAASIAATALNQFKLGAEDMTGVANIMAGAANASATGVSEIGMALSFVGPLAQTAGISFEETAGMIALFANAGIDSARAGTALRAMITSLSNPTAQATEAMQALGLATEDGSNVFFDAEGNMKSMTETTDLIRNAFSGLTTEQQLLYGEMIFGSAQLSALGAITSSTAEDFAALNTTIQNTSAADVAQTRMGNLQGTIEEMWGSVETAAIKIGTVLIPALTAAATAIGQAVDWFSNLDAGVQSAIVQTAALVGGLLLVGGTIIKVVSFVSELVSAVKLIGTVMDIAGKATAIWNGITKAAAAVQAAFNLVMAANPIGLIIAAIAAVVAALIWFFTQTELGQEIVANVTRFITEAWNNVANFIGAALTNIGNFFTDVWTNIMNFLGPIFEVIATIIRTYIEIWVNIFLVLAAVLVTIWNAIVAAATWVWETIYNFVKPIIDAIVSFITDTFRNFQLGWQIIWDTVSKFFQDVWNNIVDFIRPIVMAILNFILPIIRNIQAGWEAVWSAVGSFFSSIWNGIVSAVSGAVQSVFDIVGGIWGTIMGFFSGVGNWLFSVGQDLIMGMVEGISSMLGDIIGAIGDVVNGAIDWAKDVLGIQSPSKVFADIGNDTMLGLMQGIEDLTPDLEKQINDLGLSMSADMQSSLDNASMREVVSEGGNKTQNLNYYAQPGGAQLEAEDELFTAMRRAKVVVPGW